MKAYLSARQIRSVKVTAAQWRRRVIFLAGGIAVGAAAVVLAQVSDWAQIAFGAALAKSRYASFVITPLGFALSVFLTIRYFPNSQGSGIPQAIAARQLNDQEARGRLVSMRIAIGKVLLTVLGLLCGASVGREGPTVQVGASIMFAIGRMSPRRQPGLILAGAAAGVAAAFNTPLAGVVFAIEELSHSFEARTSGTVLTAVIIAGITTMGLLGNYTYFGTASAQLDFGSGWVAVLACGVCGGLAGGSFSALLLRFAQGLPGLVGRWIAHHPILFATLCGLLIAIVGWIGKGSTYGTGYAQARMLVVGRDNLPALFFVLKFIASVLSYVSGIPGGIFAPSLAVGAGLGHTIAHVLPQAPAGAVVLLGMVAYFSGVVQAPITAVIIVMEMTDDQRVTIPLMATAVLAYGVSRLICRRPLYATLAKRFLLPSEH
jgi:H+/Cl- antiporter ClcA